MASKLGYTQVLGHLEAQRDLRVGIASGDGITVRVESGGIKIVPRESGTEDATKELFYDTANNRWAVETDFYINGAAALTTANEGAGNGIDADTLDGQEGSYYLDLGNSTGDLSLANISDISADRVIGRISSGGAPQELTAANIRTLINVEDGATSDQTGSEILSSLLSVDGASSGLDADLLDSQEGSYYLDLGNSTGNLSLSTRTVTGDYVQANSSLSYLNSTNVVIGGDTHLDLTGTVIDDITVGAGNPNIGVVLYSTEIASLAFANGVADTNNRIYYTHSTNKYKFQANNVTEMELDSAGIATGDTNGPILAGEDATGTNPTLVPDKVDMDTGIGHDGADELTLVAGGNATIKVTSTKATLNGSDIATVTTGYRNQIINGNFDIWQRGTSLTAAAGSRYLADRWHIVSAGTTIAPSRQAFSLGQTDVPGNPKYYHRIVTSSSAGANNYAQIAYNEEDATKFSGSDSVISFYMKADSAKPVSIEVQQYFGTGGSPSSTVYTYPATRKVTLSSSWVRYEFPISLPSVSGKTLGSNGDGYLRAIIWFDAGSTFNARTDTLGQQSGTFDIACVQWEEGTTATSFEFRSPAIELPMCYRYYWKSHLWGVWHTGYTVNASPYHTSLTFPVEMRASPTMSEINGVQVGFETTGTFQFANSKGFNYYRWATATANAQYYGAQAIADAELA